MDLTCVECGKPLTGQQTRFCTDQCRYRWRDEKKMKSGQLRCALCDSPMWWGSTSRPQGEAMCRPCRKVFHAANPTTSTNPRPSYRTPCASCGTPSYGKRCLPCAHKAQIIRHDDDLQIARRTREQAAPGLTGTQRTRLLHKWKQRGRSCA